jgi:hypothetical protein
VPRGIWGISNPSGRPSNASNSPSPNGETPEYLGQAGLFISKGPLLVVQISILKFLDFGHFGSLVLTVYSTREKKLKFFADSGVKLKNVTDLDIHIRNNHKHDVWFRLYK